MQAHQKLKTYAYIGFLLIGAAIGFNGHTQNDRTPSSNLGVQTKPQVIQIPKQPPVLIPSVVQPEPKQIQTVSHAVKKKTESRNQYIVQNGDTFWIIAQKKKPENVEMYPYIDVFKKINNGVQTLSVNKPVLLPNENDLKHVILPEVKIHFNHLDKDVVNFIKEAEGSKESQAAQKRRLLGGATGPSYKNSKFVPYKDIKGNFTIGYGHFISKKDSVASKYKNGISEREAERMLKEDMTRTYNDYLLLLQRKNAINLNKEQQRLLYEMAFTLGVDKLSTFDKLWKSVKNGNSHKFKKEVTNSLWYRQVGNRAEILVNNL